MRLLLPVVLLFFSLHVRAQEGLMPETEKNQAVAVYAGGLLGPVLSLNYEYTINPSFRAGKSILYVRAGGGYMNFWGEEYGFMAAQLGVLTGADKKHHLDVGIGPLMTFPYDGLFPVAITIAYRFQKPDGKSYFRIGAGVVEGFQVSGGFRF